MNFVPLDLVLASKLKIIGTILETILEVLQSSKILLKPLVLIYLALVILIISIQNSMKQHAAQFQRKQKTQQNYQLSPFFNFFIPQTAQDILFHRFLQDQALISPD